MLNIDALSSKKVDTDPLADEKKEVVKSALKKTKKTYLRRSR
jgi:hypothetical protein